MFGGPFLDYPTDIFTKNKDLVDRIPEDTISISMMSMGLPADRPDIWDCSTPEYTQNLRRMFALSKIWQLEAARSTRDAVKASGLFLTPSIVPFWQEERRRLVSALHAKIGEAQQAMLATITPDIEAGIDVSPLTIVALDGALERGMLWDTILAMRRDYAELRKIGNSFAEALASADRNEQIADVLTEWRDSWDRILRGISKAPKPILQKLFSWDVIKKGSLKGMFLEAADALWLHFKDLETKRGLSLVRHLQSEVYFSRPVAKRIEELFGGQVKP